MNDRPKATASANVRHDLRRGLRLVPACRNQNAGPHLAKHLAVSPSLRLITGSTFDPRFDQMEIGKSKFRQRCYGVLVERHGVFLAAIIRRSKRRQTHAYPGRAHRLD